MHSESTTKARPRRQSPTIEVFQLRRVGEVIPDGISDLHMIDAAFQLIGQAARECVRTDEPVESEFRFTDSLSTWSVTVTSEPVRP